MSTTTLAGKAFRLDPTRVSWSYDVRTSERDTLGGRVVQIFGAEISDVTVEGTFGAGGWREQETWLANLVDIAEGQARGNLPPIHFVYPGLGVDIQCYLKSFAQPEGSSVTASDSIIAPQWVITLVPLEDAGTLRGLREAAITGYIERLSVGIGWKQTQYNGPLTAADLAAAIGGNNDAAAQVFFAKTAEPVAWAALQAAAALVAAGGVAPAPGSGPGAPPTGPGVPLPAAGAISMAQVIAVARAAGFTGESLVLAGAVGKAESGLNPRSHNTNASTGDNSYGLWQINMLGSLGPARLKAYNLTSNDQLFDPATNARVAFLMSAQGTNWRPWSAFKNGAHQKFMAEARAAAGV